MFGVGEEFLGVFYFYFLLLLLIGRLSAFEALTHFYRFFCFSFLQVTAVLTSLVAFLSTADPCPILQGRRS